jgi:hypothetical protein
VEYLDSIDSAYPDTFFRSQIFQIMERISRYISEARAEFADNLADRIGVHLIPRRGYARSIQRVSASSDNK